MVNYYNQGSPDNFEIKFHGKIYKLKEINMANMSDDLIGNVSNYNQFDDEETKILERETVMAHDMDSVDVNFDDEEVMPNFRDVGIYSYPHNIIAVLAGMTLVLFFYLSLWLN